MSWDVMTTNSDFWGGINPWVPQLGPLWKIPGSDPCTPLDKGTATIPRDWSGQAALYM